MKHQTRKEGNRYIRQRARLCNGRVVFSYEDVTDEYKEAY